MNTAYIVFFFFFLLLYIMYDFKNTKHQKKKNLGVFQGGEEGNLKNPCIVFGDTIYGYD